MVTAVACGAEQAFRQAWERARERAARLGQPVLAVCALPLDGPPPHPAAAFARARTLARTAALWHPPAGPARVAAGEAWRHAWPGPGGPPPSEPPAGDGAAGAPHPVLAAAEEAWRRLLEASAGPAAPWAMVAAAFDLDRPAAGPWHGLPRLLLWVPRLALVVGDGGAELWLAARVAPGDGGADAAATAALLRRWLEAGPAVAGGEPAGGPAAPHGAAPAQPARAEASAAQPAPAGHPGPASEEAREAWRAAVAAALAAIRRRELDKVVLARSVEVPCAVDPAAVAARLRAAQPHATVFALERDGRCFLGATPERLLSLAGRHCEVDCLAGSAPRGATPEEDEALAARLLASAKDRAEHAWVVRAVREALAPWARRVDAPAAPGLLRLAQVQHLHTPVRAELHPGVGPLALAAALHPTPAVAGWPRATALAFLRRHEPFDRGGYAGFVGWLGPEQAELAVAIRCGLLGGGRAWLYAGCGVVEGSDPDREWDETTWKLQALARALAEAGATASPHGPDGGPADPADRGGGRAPVRPQGGGRR